MTILFEHVNFFSLDNFFQLDNFFSTRKLFYTLHQLLRSPYFGRSAPPHPVAPLPLIQSLRSPSSSRSAPPHPVALHPYYSPSAPPHPVALHPYYSPSTPLAIENEILKKGDPKKTRKKERKKTCHSCMKIKISKGGTKKNKTKKHLPMRK